MARVHFTPNLERHVSVPERGEGMWLEVAESGATVGELLERVFAAHPRLRGYVVDDQGALRHHMNVFVNGEMIEDRRSLGDRVAPDAEIYVMQALSGG